MKNTSIKSSVLHFLLAGLLLLIFSCKQKTESALVVEQKKEILPAKSVNNSKYLKEKDLLDYIPSALKIKPNPVNGAPFDSLDYDRIIAYDFEGGGKTYNNIINGEGKFVPVIIAQKALNQQQA